jgi:hypothetical protein
MDNGANCSLIYQSLLTTKIRCIAFHPSRTWLAVGDEKGFVSLHDYENNVLLHRVQADLAVEGKGHNAGKATPIRMVTFLDEQVAFWRIYNETILSGGYCSTPGVGVISRTTPPGQSQRGTMIIAVTGASALAVICGAAAQEVRNIRGLDVKVVTAIDTVQWDQVPAPYAATNGPPHSPHTPALARALP